MSINRTFLSNVMEELLEDIVFSNKNASAESKKINTISYLNLEPELYRTPETRFSIDKEGLELVETEIEVLCRLSYYSPITSKQRSEYRTNKNAVLDEKLKNEMRLNQTVISEALVSIEFRNDNNLSDYLGNGIVDYDNLNIKIFINLSEKNINLFVDRLFLDYQIESYKTSYSDDISMVKAYNLKIDDKLINTRPCPIQLKHFTSKTIRLGLKNYENKKFDVVRLDLF